MTGTERRWLKSQGLDWRKVHKERIEAAREKERLERVAFLNRDRFEEVKPKIPIRRSRQSALALAFAFALTALPDGNRRS